MSGRYIFHDTQLKQGADWALSVQLTDDNDVPISLSGYTAYCQFRTEPGGTVLMSANSGTGGYIVIDAPNGEIGINLPASVTKELPAVELWYDLFIKNTSVTQVVLNGRIEVVPAITEIG